MPWAGEGVHSEALMKAFQEDLEELSVGRDAILEPQQRRLAERGEVQQQVLTSENSRAV